jgi:hypothetical protein
MTLPHMVSSDEDIRNNAATFASRFGDTGANAASVAAMRSPSVAGQISGPSRAGYQAELDTLLNASNNTNLGAGPAYVQSRANAIRGILGQNTDPYSSQGGLVSAPGEFARGGFAGGGYTDPMGAYYRNAALDYYGPQGTQNAGLGAIIAQGGGQRYSLTPAQAAPRPPQKDAIAEANQMAGLATNSAKFYDWAKDKSKTSGYNNDFIPGGDNKDAVIDLNTDPNVESIEELARGGLAAHRHHYRGDGFVPYGGGLGGGFLSGILQDQAQEPQRQLMDSKTKPTAPKPQSSPVGEAMQIANFGKMGKGPFEWAGKQLAGEASPTGLAGATGDAAAGLGGAEAGGGALAGDIGGGTGAILGDVGADVAGGAAADAAAGLGADVAVDAAAPEMMAGLAGGEGVADFLPFLFLKNGGAAHGRRHFDGEDGSYVEPDQTTIVSKGNKLPKVPVPDNRPGPEDALVSSAPTRAPKGGVAPSSSFSMPDFSGLVPEGAKETLTSENFWVPALAGVGAMLASPNKTLLGAVGSGLVGGTTAYTNLEKQQNEMMAKRVEMMKNVFSGPFFSEDGKTQYWRMAGNPNRLTREQYNAAASKFLNIPGANGAPSQAVEAPPPPTGTATKPKNEAVEIARGTTVEPAPKPREAAPSVAAGAPAPAPAAATGTPPAAAAPAPAPAATTPAPAAVVPAAAAATPAAAALNPAITKAALIKQALAPGSTAFDGLPASKDPRILQPKIDAYNQRIDQLNATIQSAQSNPEAMAGTEGEKQITLWQTSLNNLKAQRDDLARTLDASVDSVIGVPLARAVKDAETRADLQAKLDFLGPTKAAELAEELKKRAITDPLDVKKAVDTAVGTAQGTLDTDEKKVAFGKNIDRQSAAQEKAFQMATQGQQLVNQAHAYMKAVTDKDGNIVVSGGPLGGKFATASQVLQQMGFSPKFAQDLTGTDPNAAGASKKLQASFASEMARLDLEKSPAVREFSTYMNTSPGVDLPEKTLVWLMNNVIVPKAEAMKKGYLSVAGLKPEKDNIERALFDYNETNPWFSQETAPTIAGGRAQGAQTTQPARRDVPANTPPNLVQEELRRRAAQGRQ